MKTQELRKQFCLVGRIETQRPGTSKSSEFWRQTLDKMSRCAESKKGGKNGDLVNRGKNLKIQKSEKSKKSEKSEKI